MDASLAKTFKTSRGYTYKYYYAPAHEGKPTLLFSHGFPSTAASWHKQAAFFKAKGFGVLVPDLLGYGGTDQPTHVESYRLKSIVKDLVDILDHENVKKNVIAIGHDLYVNTHAFVCCTINCLADFWHYFRLRRGAYLTSRLAVWSRDDDRFIAFGFFAVSYMPPAPDFNIYEYNRETKAKYGYEIDGYQLFFDADGTNKIIKDHVSLSIAVVST